MKSPFFAFARFLSRSPRVAEAIQNGATYRDLDTALKKKQLFLDDALQHEPSSMDVEKPDVSQAELQQVPVQPDVSQAEPQQLPVEEKRLCELDYNDVQDAETTKAVWHTMSLIPGLFREYEKFDCNLACSKEKTISWYRWIRINCT